MDETSLKTLLRELGIRPQKSRGQNFLLDPAVLQAIANAGGLTADDHVLEIGPGPGILTSFLEPHASLTVVEIEEAFCEHLRRKHPTAKVLCEDIREVDFSELFSQGIVFGNVPYSFSTDIVFHLLKQRNVIKRAVLLLQREFAERMAAKPGGRTYGSLSVACQLWAKVDCYELVPGDAFFPEAQVESAIVTLDMLKEPAAPVDDFFAFERVVRASFAQKRRKIGNSLSSTHIASPQIVAQVLERAGIESNCRAETLSLDEFAKLTTEFAKVLYSKPSD